ncbi:MAG: hypothetical protein COA50_14190 [Flavobacteriaceae bacterium]|nr:MAG: hypothetical protein COA50_14190 [Flavobacteriaceae bacterium]
MRKENKLLLLCILLFSFQLSHSQSVFGKWKTVDDRNGVEKAVINVYEDEGAMYAKVIKILEKGKENATCVKCKGVRKDKPVEGMMIIDSLIKNKKGEYTGKTLFDPEQAMTFRCKIWLNPDNSNELKVRGYLAFIYRTQTWIRATD